MPELALSAETLSASVLGQYAVRGKIGSGGMSDVYSALHTVLDKHVAIKTLKKRFLDDKSVVTRFLREGQLASRIRHPNIVDITDVGLIGGLPCLVMEYLEGESLDAVLKRAKEGPPIPVRELVDTLLPIIAAVDFAHEHGILHRDLKPSNIFLARSWNGEVVPKVLDFGISKFVHESSDHAPLTTDSAFVGTPHYASPELIRADKTIDLRSDEYAMGVILYEGSTGKRPYAPHGPGFVTLAFAICEGQFPPPREINPNLSEEFERVVLRAMALNPEDRYPTMRALGKALLPYASDRARMIWTPAFNIATNLELSPETAVIPVPVALASSARLLPSSNSSSYPASPLQSGPQPLPPAQVFAHLTGPFPVVNNSMTPPAAYHERIATFSGSTGSSIHLQQRSPAWVAPVIVVAVLLAAGVTAAVGLIVKGQSRTTATTPSAEVATTYAVHVRPIPETAVIEIDGVVAGTGAVSRTYPRDGHSHTLRISAPGYETTLVTFDDQHGPPDSVALRPVGVGAAAEPPTGGVASSKPPATPHVAPNPGRFPPPPAKKSDRGSRTDNINPWE